jgi:hypothetical protein
VFYNGLKAASDADADDVTLTPVAGPATDELQAAVSASDNTDPAESPGDDDETPDDKDASSDAEGLGEVVRVDGDAESRVYHGEGDNGSGRPIGEPEWVSDVLHRRGVAGVAAHEVTPADADESSEDETETVGAADVESVWFLRERLPGVGADAPNDGGTVSALPAFEAYLDAEYESIAAKLTEKQEEFEDDSAAVSWVLDSLRTVADMPRLATFSDLVDEPLASLGGNAVVSNSVLRELTGASRLPRVDSIPVLSREVSESDGAASDAGSIAGERSEDAEGVCEASLLLEPLSFVRPADHEKYAAVVQAQSNAMQQQERESNSDHDFSSSDADASRLYDVELRDLVGVDVGFRGRNPYSDHANSSTRYFKMYGRNSARDYVAKATYNGLLWLLVLAGERDVRNPHGSLNASEHLAAWLQAHEEGILPEGDKVPSKALIAAAIEQGVADWSDVGEQEVPDGEGGTMMISEGLPREKYAETLRQFEDAYGVSPGRWVPPTESEFEVDDLETEETAVEFAQRFLKKTDDPDEQMKDKYDYPRMPTEMVWKTAKFWAEEINDVPLKAVMDGGKKDIRVELDTSKANILYAGQKQQCYKRVKFNEAGYQLYELVPEDYSPE